MLFFYQDAEALLPWNVKKTRDQIRQVPASIIAYIEGGNVSIGMIRKRARGIRDTEYFKLKIRKTSVTDTQSMFYIGA